MLRTCTYTHQSHQIFEYHLPVPLDHFGSKAGKSKELPERIEIYAREIVAPGGAGRPRLVFLQGGPGGAGPRVADLTSGWIARALRDYRVVLLDQRGTGRSTRADSLTLSVFPTPALQAEYMGYFRADQIVADCEALRIALCGPEGTWSTLGQSYGGFITLAYLSAAPQHLNECYITGGIPALEISADQLYRTTFALTAEHNSAYFSAYPQSEKAFREVCAHLEEETEYLPCGAQLTSRWLRTVGIALGGQGGIDAMHYFFEAPFVNVGGKRRLSQDFLFEAQSRLLRYGAPLYALVHEAIYAGVTVNLASTATNWAAHRIREEAAQVQMGFSVNADPLDYSRPYLMTGEHIFPWEFEVDPALRPLKETANLLAQRTDWTTLYDLDMLAANQVPVAAAVYSKDMFVPAKYSLQTAERMGNTCTWTSNSYEHDGLRASGEKVLDQLIRMVKE